MQRDELFQELGDLLDQMKEKTDALGSLDIENIKTVYPLYARAIPIARLLGISAEPIDFMKDTEDTSNHYTHASALAKHIIQLDSQYIILKKTSELEKNMSDQFVSLSRSEMRKIQNLINELRGLINESDTLDNMHKRRLLKRLEALQSEIHKVKSDVDVALAGFAEIGTVLGKFGKSVKPLVDRMEQIAQIFESKREAPLELPAPPKQLPAPGEHDDGSGSGD